MPARDTTAALVRSALLNIRLNRRGYFHNGARLYYFTNADINEIIVQLEAALASAEGRTDDFPRPLGAPKL